MRKVLLADDEYLVREAIKMIVEEIENVEVIGEAATAEEAFNLATSHVPEIILLDINIPGMNIQHFLHKMKDSTLKNSLVFLLGFDLPYGFNRAADYGADGLIGKPINKKEIIETFNRQLPPYKIDVERHGEPKSIQGKKEIQSALDYIEKNFEKGVTLEEVAEYVHLSTFYLSKLFKKELNVNFVSYVIERKIEKAKELLESTDMPVLNIALELNYQEPNYFSKVFKKVTGMTPSDYRKRNEKNEKEILKRHHRIPNGKWYV